MTLLPPEEAEECKSEVFTGAYDRTQTLSNKCSSFGILGKAKGKYAPKPSQSSSGLYTCLDSFVMQDAGFEGFDTHGFPILVASFETLRDPFCRHALNLNSLPGRRVNVVSRVTHIE